MARIVRGSRAAAVVVAGWLVSAPASLWAAGFQVSEQTVLGLGRAFAGAGVVGDDLSAVFYNPAGMTLLPGVQVQAGGTFVLPSAVFRGTSTRVPVDLATGMPVGAPTIERGRGAGGADALVPHFYATGAIIDRLHVGLGVTAPFGLITDYETDWVGRYHALRSVLRTYDINPSVAYRVTPWLSVGAGFSAQYASVSLSRGIFTGMGPDALAKVSGTDWGFGYDFGVLLQPTDWLRWGASFRSKIEHNLDGELRLTRLAPQTQKAGAKATTTLPETLHTDLYAQVTDELGVSLGFRWTNWSRFDELRIRFDDGRPDEVTPEDWQDNAMVKVGVDWRLPMLPALVVRGGFAYETSPVKNRFTRTPRIPDAERYWLAFGLSYRPLERLSVDVGYAHIFSPSSRVVNTVPIAQPAPGTALVDTLDGEFDSSANLVGIQASWRF